MQVVVQPSDFYCKRLGVALTQLLGGRAESSAQTTLLWCGGQVRLEVCDVTASRITRQQLSRGRTEECLKAAVELRNPVPASVIKKKKKRAVFLAAGGRGWRAGLPLVGRAWRAVWLHCSNGGFSFVPWVTFEGQKLNILPTSTLIKACTCNAVKSHLVFKSLDTHSHAIFFFLKFLHCTRY